MCSLGAGGAWGGAEIGETYKGRFRSFHHIDVAPTIPP